MKSQGFTGSQWVIIPTFSIEVMRTNVELTFGWLKWYLTLTFKRKIRGHN